MTALELGRNIAKLRRAQSLSQKELAKMVWISVSYLSKIEEGSCSRPHMKTLSRIALALNVSIDELD
jgi:transcriptional regulator with XRE-family HTH domain